MNPKIKIDNPFFNLTSLVIAIAGNIFLIGAFVLSLVFPLKFKYFVINTGPLIVLLEFFSIRAAGQLIEMRKRSSSGGSQFKLLFFYFLFAVVISVIFKNWILPFYFILSLLLKIFGLRSAKEELNLMWPAFIVSFILTAVVAGFLKPFPDEIIAYEGEGLKSYFVGNFQATLLWGAIYFGLITLKELIDFIKAKNKFFK